MIYITDAYNLIDKKFIHEELKEKYENIKIIDFDIINKK